jgi:RNA polymerase sigma factor (sigma-70 family)
MDPSYLPALDNLPFEAPTKEASAAPSPLLQALRRREQAAQARTIREHRAVLEMLAKRMLSCPQEAQALVADVFTDFLYKYVDTIRNEPAIPMYLRMMTIRRCRRLSFRRASEEELDRHQETLAATNMDIVDAIDAHVRLSSLDECLGRLTEKARRLLRLHFGHEMSFNEIGAQVGTSKQAVGKTVLKSLAVLRRCLDGRRAQSRPGQEAQ